jgi:cytochrome c oxidase subunit 3
MPAVTKVRRLPPNDPSNARFAIGLFLIAEVMFFAGLVAAYIVLRFASTSWRPEDFPQLALGLPLVNTVVLTVSALFLYLGSRSLNRENPRGLVLGVAITLVAGTAFVIGQVVEFGRLLAADLPMQEGDMFGNMFYAMAGLHAAHVAGGVLLLLFVLLRAIRGKYHQYRRGAVDLACCYWGLVVVVWIFFFLILYVF